MTTSKQDFIQFVKTHTKELFAYTFSKVQQKEVAEDLVQEMFLSAYQSYDSFQGKSSVKTWLFSILKRKIADHYRLRYKNSNEVSSGIIGDFFDENHRWRPEHRPKEWPDEKDLLDDPEFSKSLSECFKNLPEKWSSAIRLKYLEEHDADGICNQLEISKSNFWQIIHRAKLSLRNCLELKWFK
ncbi:sigma-70 family RNA polymerase sigma factor [Flavisolibacter nicotianae]|uniref:sigma-70 family RNA polymerase sigma factor n=1 Tax=Flavisolibacter nicotianae TaxID=2364882 RepID=UPI000EB01943|nr:sigma-70 family RNA polymerase sigma factor [Flavisolibacter nicotianae]